MHPSSLIECEQVAFAYATQSVLRGVSLKIERAETLVLLGRSGCGKTTLLKLIAGMLRPNAGEIRYEAPINNAYAFAFQSPVFFPWLTVQQNVVRVCEFNNVRPDAARFLQPFGLAPAATRYPWQLSGGMQRRLSIAMALSLQRPFLLLDEPGAGLDDWTKETLLDVLEFTLDERDTTCVATTHSLFEAVVLADRIILLGGSPATVLFEYGVRLPRPRLRADEAFGRIMSEVEHLRAALAPYREDS